ncbi:SprB repeat-containing protein, partial [Membranihabitans marinus]|uniref:SprB repeat-containing protein n=1 Tax=Membranihabitans marinus TaxID=1227546 RepID=UPI001F366FF5
MLNKVWYRLSMFIIWAKETARHVKLSVLNLSYEKFLIYTLFLLLSGQTSAQSPHPVLDWSTYFGGTTGNRGLHYVVGDDGSTYFGSVVVSGGWDGDANYGDGGTVTTPDAWQTDFGTANNPFSNSLIGKFSPDGELEYSSYLRTNHSDQVIAIGQDDDYVYYLCNIYSAKNEPSNPITVQTTANNFGLASRNNSLFCYLAKVEKSTMTPVLVTELPGSEHGFLGSGSYIYSPRDENIGIVAEDGYAYITNTRLKYGNSNKDSWGYVIKPDNTGVLLPGLDNAGKPNLGIEIGRQMIAENGDLILLGAAKGNSGDFLTTDGTDFAGPNNTYDMFLRRYDRNGNLVFSTLFGGSNSEKTRMAETYRSVMNLVELPNGNIVVSGMTLSNDIVYSDGTIDDDTRDDIFMVTYDGQGQKLWTKAYIFSNVYTRYLTLEPHPDGESVIVYSVIFQGSDNDFEITADAIQPDPGDRFDLYIAFVDGSTGNTNYGTYWGGDSQDYPSDWAYRRSIVVDGNDILFTGYSHSTDLITTPGATREEDGIYLILNSDGSLKTSAVIDVNPIEVVIDGDYIYVFGDNYYAFNTSSVNAMQPMAISNGDPTRIVKICRKTGKVVYKTYLGGRNSWDAWLDEFDKYWLDGERFKTNPRFIDGKLYVGSSIGDPEEYPTTTDAHQPIYTPDAALYKNFSDLTFFSFDLEKEVNWLDNTLSPTEQSTCINGLIGPITGNRVIVDPDELPDIYRDGIETYPEQKATYQWQQADSPGGPWEDINGAILQDYHPSKAGSVDIFFRRIALDPNNCSPHDTISISNVHSVIINNDVAPVADAGLAATICMGQTWQLGGVPAATGGVPPYTYHWTPESGLMNLADTNIARPVVQPDLYSIYTLEVTDAAGCQDLDQVPIKVWSYDAGPDKYLCGDEYGVRIGTFRPAGEDGIVYDWSVVSGDFGSLSCTDCDRPIASPNTNTVYEVEVTFPSDAGGTCSFTDQVIVNVVNEPITDFAGPDMATCLNNFISIHENYDTITIGNPSLPTTPGYKYQWTPLNGYIDLSEQNDPTLTFSNRNFFPDNHEVTYTLTMLTPEGCEFKDEVTVYTLKADMGPDRCATKVIGDQFNSDPYQGNALYTYNILEGDGRLDIDGDCMGDDINGTISGPNLTSVRVLENEMAAEGSSNLVEQIIEYKGFVCKDTVRIEMCEVGGCDFDIASDDNNCLVAGPNDTLTLIPVTGGLPWPDNSEWTFEWTNSDGDILSTEYSLKVVDANEEWYFLKITAFSAFDFDDACSDVEGGRPPEYVTCIDSIKINELGSGLPTVNLQDYNICRGDSVFIGDPLSAFNFEWSGVSESGIVTDNNPRVSPSETTEYTVIVHDEMTGCFITDTVEVAVNHVEANAGKTPRFICEGAVIQLGEDEAVEGWSYQWQPTVAPWRQAPPNTTMPASMGDTLAQPYVLIAAPLTFYLEVTDDESGCVDRDTLQVNLSRAPKVEARDPGVICLGDDVLIGTIENNPDYNYEWFPTTGLDCSTCSEASASPAVTTDYVLTVRYNNPACHADTILSIQVEVNEADITMAGNQTFCPSAGALNLLGPGANTNQGNAITAYSWTPTLNMDNPNIASPTVDPAPINQTTYTVNITDINGCKAQGMITYSPTLRASAGSDKELCLGERVTIGSASNTGSISWTGLSGAPLAALSSTNQPFVEFDSEISGAGTFNYQVTINSGGCTSSDIITIEVTGIDPLPPLESITLCRNSCGVIGFENTEPNQAFYWNPTVGLDNIFGSMTGVCVDSVSRTYTLIKEDELTGCVTSTEVSVEVSDLEAPEAVLPDISACFGQIIDLEPYIIGETGNETYDWSPSTGLSNPFIKNPILNTNDVGMGVYTYELTVTDEHGCTRSTAIDIVISDDGCCTPPVINTIVNDAECGLDNGLASIVLPMDPSNYIIEWATTEGDLSLDHTQRSNIGLGSYRVKVVETAYSEFAACYAEELLVVGTNAENPVVSQLVNIAANCSEGTLGMVELSPRHYNYRWSDGGTGYLRNDLEPGCYVVEMNAVGQSCSDLFEVCVKSSDEGLAVNVTTENPTCGSDNGSIFFEPIGGQAPYFIEWSDGSIDVFRDNLPVGVYDVTVTDATGCSKDTMILLTNAMNSNYDITVETRDPLCAGENTGRIIVDLVNGASTPPHQIMILNNYGLTLSMNDTLDGLLPGDYTVVIVNGSGCWVESEVVRLNDPPTMHLDIDRIEAADCNDEYGSIELHVNGGSPSYTYLWGPDGQTTQNLIGVESGTYTISVTDANGCILSSQQTIGSEEDCCPRIGIQSSVVVDSECGMSTGTAAVVPTGSPSGYTFNWYNSNDMEISTDSLITGLLPGAYRVVVRADVPACTDSVEYVLTVGSLQGPRISISSVTDATCMDADGSATVMVDEGVGPYNYLWSNGQTGNTLTNVVAGIYSVVVTDANGCTETEVVTIGESSGDLSVSIIGSDAACNGSNGSTTVNVSGGTAPFTYLWNTGSTSKNLINLVAGYYEVLVTDANGCSTLASVAIGNQGGPELTATVNSDVLCIGDASGIIHLSSSTPGTLLALSDDQGLIVGTGPVIENLWAGTYHATAYTELGCRTVTIIEIAEPAEVLDLEITSIELPICDMNNPGGVLGIDVMGGSPNYSYNWSNGGSSKDLINITGGAYSVMVTDANGCVVAEGYELELDPNCSTDIQFEKELAGLTPTGTVNEFLLEYNLIARNDDVTQGYYSLYDSIAFADGVSVVGSPSITYLGGDGLSGMINTMYDGVSDELIVMNDTVGPGMVDTFRVSYILQMDYSVISPALADCDPSNNAGNTGLTNVASLVSPIDEILDSVCVPIPLPGVRLTKEILTDAMPTGNGYEYTTTYVILVEDTTGLRVFYDLSDTIMFGLGANFESAVITYGGSNGLQTSLVTASTTDTAYQIVDDEAVENFEVDSFYVEVTFTVDHSVLTSESADCDYTNDGGGNSGLTNVAVINDGVPVARDTVCQPIPKPGLMMTKEVLVNAMPTGNVNEYTTTYVIRVEDTTGYRAYYDLSDTIKYGLGAEFVSATVSYGGADGLQTGLVTANPVDTAYQIVDDEYIENFGVDSFYVEVVFTIDPNTLTAESADCDYSNDGGGNSGLTNVAVINDGVPIARDSTCQPIPMPGVLMTKDVLVNAMPTGNVNEFTTTYVIRVEDTTGTRSYYDLSDTIKYGLGADFVSAVVTYGGDDNLQTSILNANPTDTAYQIVDDEYIENFGVDSFYVEVVFTIDPNTLTAESADCDYSNDGGGNSGLTNVAVINDGVPVSRDSTCQPIPMPGVLMTKEVLVNAMPTGNVNEFTTTYVIRVEDTTGTRSYYDLSDTIKYGLGADFVSAVVTYGGPDGLQTGIVTANPMDTAYQIVDDEFIENFGVDSFYVEVVFIIDPNTLTAESADCDYSNDGGGNSGLTNVAVINDGVPVSRDSTCQPIPMPGVLMTKEVLVNAMPTGNINEFTTTYVIRIEDTTGVRAYYDLSDTIKYGLGAEFVSGLVSYGGADGLQTSIITSSPMDTAYQIVDNEYVENFGVDSFYVEVVFTVDPNTLTAESADCDYSNDGGGNSGLTNVAVINDGVPISRDSTCQPIPMPGLLMTKDVLVNAMPTGNINEYTTTYVIRIEDTTGVRAYYDLSDTIKYGLGAEFVSGLVSYGGADGLQTVIVTTSPMDTAYQIVDNEYVENFGVDSFYVEVVFTIDPNTLTAESADCDYSNDGGGNSGLTNVAVINDGVPVSRDSTCQPIPMPGVLMTKDVLVNAIPTGNVNEFTTTYVIRVEDTTGNLAYYDLSDTIKYGLGANFVSGMVTYGGSNGLQTSMVTPSPMGTAYQIVDNETIENFEVDSFYVEVTFTIDPNTLTAESADCDYTNDGGDNSGLTNVAVINDGVPVFRDSTCQPIPMPGVLMTKDVLVNAMPTGNVNEFTTTYVIRIEDTTGVRAYYDLSDTIKYGLGANFVSGLVSYGGGDGLQTSIITASPMDTAYQIVDNEYVENFGVDSFYVEVVFTIDPNTLTAESADCDYTNDGGGNSGLTNVAVINDGVPVSRDSTCQPIPMPGLLMTKDILVNAMSTGNVNEYTTTYVIRVEDTTGIRSYYDLSDTIKYGLGAEFVSAEITYGGPDGLQTGIVTANPLDTAYQIVDDEYIENFGVDSFYVEVIFTIDPNTLTAESADCDYTNDGGGNSGLTNVAVIFDGVPMASDTICQPIPLPGVAMSKDILVEARPTGVVNQFTTIYVIRVEDTTGVRAYYDLSDTIKYGLGADFISAVVTYGGPDGLQTSIVTANPMDTAFQIVDDEVIENFGVDSFYVEVLFSIDPNVITEESADCDYTNDGGGNSGLTNVAVINDGVPLDRDTICQPIPLPSVYMTKEIIVDAMPTGNVNEYTTTYVIRVEDGAGNLAYYDLSDTIKYGLGAEFVSATVTYGGSNGLQTSIVTANPLDTAFQIVDDEVIENFEVDSFYVEVIFTIDPNILTAESADCDYSNDGGGNSGLTNVAVINDGVPIGRDTTCQPIPLPGVMMTKDVLVNAEPTGNINEFTTTYVIRVEDTTGHRAYYDLSDTIKYGLGADFISAEITYGGPDGLQTSIVTTNTTDTAYQIVNDEYIENFGVDSFYVEVVFTIDPNTLTAESADCDYSNDGGANSGLTNVAVIDDGVPMNSDTICQPIPMPGVLMTKDILVNALPTGNINEFSTTYVIRVEDTTGVRAYYDLSDTIKYGLGAEFVSAVVTYGGDDNLQTSILNANPTDTAYQIVDDEYIENFGVDSFYVEVVFTIDPNTLTAESADCDYTNDGGANSGLTNVAVINDGVPVSRDSTCQPIPMPGVLMTKDILVNALPTGNINEFTTTYVIRVEDTTGFRAYYDLSDTIKYGLGAEFVSAMVTYGGDDNLQTIILNANPTDTAYQIVDDEYIENFGVDSFYVEVVFTVDPNTLTAESADCDYTNDGGGNSGLTNVAVINDGVPVSRDSTCQPIPMPGVLMTKDVLVNAMPTGNVNEFTTTYVIRVEDTTGTRSYYDLSDTIKYGLGADFVSAVVTYGGPDGLQTGLVTASPMDTAYQIVDDEYIENFGVDSFYVEVVFTVDPNTITAESADCDYTNDGGGNSGLTNVAVINDGVPVSRDSTCQPIPMPGVLMTKDVLVNAMPTGNVNEFTTTYVIRVEDTTGTRSYYDLSDTLKYGLGADFVSAVVTYGGPDGLQTGLVTASPVDTAYQIVDDEYVENFGVDSFYVEVVFTVDPNTLTAESADCDYTNDGGGNSGLTNVAVINDGVPVSRDSTCQPIPMPGVLMTKDVLVNAMPTGNVNEFTTTYVIRVEDTTGTRSYYDLSDTIKYGLGADFVSAAVTYGGPDGLQTGIVTVSPMDTAYQIVDDEYIENFGVDSFYVEVVFTIDPNTLTAESADCDYSNDGGANSGLTNVAVINDGVPISRDSTCQPIPMPGVLMTKDVLVNAMPTGNINEYTTTYVLRVEDTTGIRAYYDLSDTIKYGLGADFVSAVVTYGGGDNLQTSILNANPTDTAYQIVDDEYVENFGVDSFYVEVIFTIDPNVITAESADCDYSNDGGANSGLTNVAVINDGVPISRDTTCQPIPMPGVLMTKDVLVNAMPTGNVNEYTTTYVIRVEDTTGNLAYYDLSDTIKYGLGANFVSAEVTYGGTNGLQTTIITANSIDTAYQIVDNETVENFEIDSFYVEVIFTIDPNILTAESADCDYSNDGGGNSGLTNVAVINDGVPISRDSTCQPIPMPGVLMTKDVLVNAMPTGNLNEFTTIYVIRVEDTTGVRAYYDLSDTIKYGLGADFISAEVTYGGPDGLQTGIVTANPMDTAYQIVDNEYIENFGVDSFYVEVVFTIDPNTLTAESADCDYSNDGGGNSGLTNVAVIDDGVPISRDSTCQPVPMPGVLLTKDVLVNAMPTGNLNEFITTYVIRVEDTTGVRAYYDLSDTIKYGAGADFISGLVTYGGDDNLQTSILNANPTDTAYQIVDDEYVENFGVDSFYVEVVFTIDPNTLTAESADCDYSNDGGANSGLTNVAVINDGVPVSRDSTCQPVPMPGVLLTKDVLVNGMPTGNVNEFTTTYVIRVEDTTGVRAYYDLSDTIKYGAGAEFISGLVTYGGDDNLQTSILNANPTDTAYQIVNDEYVENFG